MQSCLRRKLTSTAIFFVRLPDYFDTFFNPKNVSETNAINITPPSISQLEKRTSSRATDDDVERWTPTTMPTTDTPTGSKPLTEPPVSYNTINRQASNVIIRVTSTSWAGQRGHDFTNIAVPRSILRVRTWNFDTWFSSSSRHSKVDEKIKSVHFSSIWGSGKLFGRP